MGIRNPPRAAPQPLRRGGVLPRPPATRRPSHYASVGSASSMPRRIHCLLSVGRHPCVPPPATLRPSRYASEGSASSMPRRIHCLLSVGRHPCVPPPATLRPSRYASVGVGVLDDPPHTLLAICRAAPMCAAAGHAPPFPLCFRRGRRPRRPAAYTACYL